MPQLILESDNEYRLELILLADHDKRADENFLLLDALESEDAKISAR